MKLMALTYRQSILETKGDFYQWQGDGGECGEDPFPVMSYQLLELGLTGS